MTETAMLFSYLAVFIAIVSAQAYTIYKLQKSNHKTWMRHLDLSVAHQELLMEHALLLQELRTLQEEYQPEFEGEIIGFKRNEVIIDENSPT